MSENNEYPQRNGDRATLVQIERRLERIETALTALTALEYDHRNTKDALLRLSQDLKTHSERLAELEKQAPVAELVRKWVIGIIWIAIAAIAGALISLVVPTIRVGGSSVDRGH